MAQRSADFLSHCHWFLLCFGAILLLKDLVFLPHNLRLCSSSHFTLPQPLPCHHLKSYVDGGGGGYHSDFGTFDIVLVGFLNYNILVWGYNIQILAFYYSESCIPGL